MEEKKLEKLCESCKTLKCQGFRHGFIFALLLICATIFFSVYFASKEKKAIQTITVNGKAQIYSKADIASIYFSVKDLNKEKNTKEIQENISKNTKSIIKDFKNIGILEKDIKTNKYEVKPKYDYSQRGSSNIVGYEGINNISVKIREEENIEKVVDILSKHKITQISGPNFEIDNEDSLKDKVRLLAIKNAKEKAKILAESLGVKLNKVVNFVESDRGENGGMYKSMFIGGSANALHSDAETPSSIQKGEEKITSNVSVVFQIND